MAGEALCHDCRIRFEHVATLGSSGDPVSIAGDAVISHCAAARLSTGEFVVSAPVGGDALVVYDGSGRAVRTIGRRGGGPGEFGGGLMLTVGPGDTLHVVDNGNGRLQVMTAAGEYVRSFDLARRVASFALLDGGRYVVAPLWSAVRAGEPLFYLYDAAGELIRTIGAWDGTTVDWGQSWSVSPAAPSGFWEVKESRFMARHWHTDGTLERSIVRTSKWFPPDAGLDPGFPAVPPPPVLSHAWQDGAGRLWLYLLVADDGWRPWPGAEEGRFELSPGWVDDAFRTRVEVLGLQPPRLLAVGSSDHVLMPICNSRLLYTALETPEGDVRIRVLEPALDGFDSDTLPPAPTPPAATPPGSGPTPA